MAPETTRSGFRAAITYQNVRKWLNEPRDRDLTIRDTTLKGFVLRLRKTGGTSYSVRYGRNRSFTIGKAPALTPEEARKRAREVLAQIELGGDPGQEQRENLTLEDFVAKHYGPWLKETHQGGEETEARLKAVFAEWLPTMLGDISAFHVEKWRAARLRSGKKPATVNRDLAAIKPAFRKAVEWKFLKSSPFTSVKPSRVDRTRIVRFLSNEEETRLRAALTARDDTRRRERESANAWRRERGRGEYPTHATYTDHLTPIVLLALNTGLRRGEVFGLRWDDIDLARQQLTVRGDGAKSGQTRHVPLNSEAVRVLQTWSPKATGLVFPGEDGDPLVDIKSAWLPVVKAANIGPFRFHDLRHTFASRLVMGGVDLNTVRELLGHADIGMSLRYAHLAPEHKAAAVEKLVRPA
jgi:integrase